MHAGRCRVLFVRGANPVYALPAAANFAEAFAKVPFKVCFSSYPDETTRAVRPRPPRPHSLEIVGRRRAGARHVSACSSRRWIRCSNTRATADVLIAARAEGIRRDGRALSRGTDYRDLADVAVPGRAAAPSPARSPKGLGAGIGARAPQRCGRAGRASGSRSRGEGDFFLVTYPSPVLGDGRGANKPWLQELPDPVTQDRCGSRGSRLHPETASAARRRARRHRRRWRRRTATVTRAGVHLPRHPSRHDRPRAGPGTHARTGRYAQGTGATRVDALRRRTHDRRRPRWRSDAGEGLASHKADRTATRDLVTTEGSARQHGRGIAQAPSPARAAGGRRDRRAKSSTRSPASARTSSCRASARRWRPTRRASSATPTSTGKDKGMYDAESLERAWRSAAGR